MVQLAATGDLHIRVGDPGPVSAQLWAATRGVDALVIAGDITENGRIVEAELAAEILSRIDVPILAVLGNHDLRSFRRLAFRQVMTEAGVVLLDGTSEVLVGDDGTRVGMADRAVAMVVPPSKRPRLLPSEHRSRRSRQRWKRAVLARKWY